MAKQFIRISLFLLLFKWTESTHKHVLNSKSNFPNQAVRSDPKNRFFTTKASQLRAGGSAPATSSFVSPQKETTRRRRVSSGVKTAAVSFAYLSFLAHSGMLTITNANRPYAHASVLRDQIACLVTVVAATTFVKVCTLAAARGALSPLVTRKLIHTFSAPCFLTCWPMYSDAFAARYFASVIMATVLVRLVVAGTAKKTTMTSSMRGDDNRSQSESELANAVSRSGDAREALGGPLLYCLNMLIITLVFWRNNLYGIMATSTMAVGDGLSDLIGRQYGRNNKWPFSDKSVAGTLAFFVGSTLASLGLISLYRNTITSFHVPVDASVLVNRVTSICAISAVVELLPLGNDNLSVPLVAIVLTKFLLD